MSLLAACLNATPVQAVMVGQPWLPVDRLVENLTAYTKEHPLEAGGFYRLARVHAMVFVDRRQSISTEPGEFRAKGDYVATINTNENLVNGNLPAVTAETHLAPAVANFAEAIKLDPQNATFRLGAAYLMEIAAPVAHCPPLNAPVTALSDAETAKWKAILQHMNASSEENRAAAARELRTAGLPIASLLVSHLKDPTQSIRAGAQSLLTELWQEQAIAEYRRAFELTIDKEIQIRTCPSEHLYHLVSYESGKSYLRLVSKRGMREDEKEFTESVKAKLAQMEGFAKQVQFQRAPVSPILFSLTAPRPLHELIDPSKPVSFDLDGDLVSEQRQWVQPDTAILVWDPACEGKITSGRQLFGNVTWWIFWNNGYEALDALDDNRDGELTAAELTGLAVWRDANQNGVSDPGEVVPVVNVGIDAISVRTTSTEDGCPANSQGLRLTDGRTLPTYDWYAPIGKPATDADNAQSK